METFALYTQNEILNKVQQENALLVAKENYALDVAVMKYNKIFNLMQ